MLPKDRTATNNNPVPAEDSWSGAGSSIIPKAPGIDPLVPSTAVAPLSLGGSIHRADNTDPILVPNLSPAGQPQVKGRQP
mmetsp:Transcript_20069/g.41272  ORF Transcript_20069/g.41272 Transcript_20069/m.41272 type:complete len:80 (+) Transcript_20069:816-1055(+)